MLSYFSGVISSKNVSSPEGLSKKLLSTEPTDFISSRGGKGIFIIPPLNIDIITFIILAIT
jgi:hypothetical protein